MTEQYDELPFTTAEDDWPPVPEREPRPCRRHEWVKNENWNGGQSDQAIMQCVRCNAIRDPERARRGRSSLRAGKDAERAIAKSYGGTRTGQFGGPDDVVVGEMFVIQSKAGGWFSERVWAELVKLQGSQRIPTLVVSDRPGPGHRTRRYVIRTLEDDIALHGAKP